MSNCADPVLGPGLRLTASNTVVGVKHWSGYTYCFETSPYWNIGISPDILSNGIAQIAKNFQYYRFTKLVFRYTPSCPTTTSRTLRFAYVPDGAYSTIESQPTFAQAADFEFNWSTASWSPASYTISRVPRSVPAFYNRTGDAAAGLRQTTQGVLIGLTDADPGASLSVGSIVLDFVIELFSKTTNLNFSVSRAEYDEFKNWQSSTNFGASAAASAAAAVPNEPEIPPSHPIQECTGVGTSPIGQLTVMDGRREALQAQQPLAASSSPQMMTHPSNPRPPQQGSGFR